MLWVLAKDVFDNAEDDLFELFVSEDSSALSFFSKITDGFLVSELRWKTEPLLSFDEVEDILFDCLASSCLKFCC